MAGTTPTIAHSARAAAAVVVRGGWTDRGVWRMSRDEGGCVSGRLLQSSSAVMLENRKLREGLGVPHPFHPESRTRKVFCPPRIPLYPL